MDSQLVSNIADSMRSAATPDLLDIWIENDSNRFSEEAIHAAKQLLVQRGIELPPRKSPASSAIVDGSSTVDPTVPPCLLCSAGRWSAAVLLFASISLGFRDFSEHGTGQVHLCLLIILIRLAVTAMGTFVALRNLTKFTTTRRLMIVIAVLLNAALIVDCSVAFMPTGQLGILGIRNDLPIWIAGVRSLRGPRLPNHEIAAGLLLVASLVNLVALVAASRTKMMKSSLST